MTASTAQRSMTDDEIRYMKYRIKMLPQQIELARRKVEHLEREAARLGMKHLLETAKCQ